MLLISRYMIFFYSLMKQKMFLRQVCDYIYIWYSLLMNKLNFYNNHYSHSTNASNLSARSASINPHQQHISPFPSLQHQPSHSKKRLQSSPLHIPLAIAINRLAKKQKNIEHCNTHRALFQHNRQRQKIEQLIQSNQLQNVKNILEQFAQSLYSTIQKEIYSKFNCEMKRMILKYRQTQSLLNKVKEKLILNADIIQLQHKFRVKQEYNKAMIAELGQKIEKMEKQMLVVRKKYQSVSKQSLKVQKQNAKLKQNNQKYENTLMSLIEQVQNQKKHDHRQRLSYLQQLQRQKQHYRNSMKQCRKPLKSMLANYQTELIKVEHSNSLSHSYIHNVNKLEPTHSPIKKQNMPIHDISKRIKPESNRCHFKLKISQKE